MGLKINSQNVGPHASHRKLFGNRMAIYWLLVYSGEGGLFLGCFT